ncbi:SAM-dependent methyltransferase [Symbioplanes lichenis]|uniref:SAM-dependent methyltransferase n=1 Tax=Symbioplanes lichenis TaxID=1629072 RepID=UPI002738E549|nr:class I SAM-dependent methyltransferase [Actinoplanes lichenis]
MGIEELLARWGQGAQALALLSAAQELSGFLREERDVAAVAAFAGLTTGRAGDVLAALVAHDLAEEVAPGRFRIAPGLAAALADDAPGDLPARIAQATLLTRQTEAAVRTGVVTLSAEDALTVARANAFRPGDGARAVVTKIFEAVPEVAAAMAHGRMLDVGSGVGGFVLTAAGMLPDMRATTLEVVPEVAAVARSRARALGVDDRVDIRVQDARDFDSPDAYDIAFWAQPFFPLPARPATLAMIHRSLRTGGLLLLQQLDTAPAGRAELANFALRRMVAHAQGLPFARPMADLVAEAAPAGFSLIRELDEDFGRMALFSR